MDSRPPSPLPVTHHYVFDLYALDAKLDATLHSPQSLMKAMVGQDNTFQALLLISYV